MSIRLRLILLVLAAVVPTAAVSLWAVFEAYENQRAAFEQSLRETTRALAMVVDRELGQREALARILADSPLLDRGEPLAEEDRRAFHRFARRVTLGTEGWVVVSTRDRQLLNTLLPDPTTPPATPAGQSPRFAFTELTPQLTPLAQGRVSGRLLASIQVPVRREGRTLLNVGVTVLPGEMQRILQEQAVPPGWVATILDSAATVVARTPRAEKWLGHPATPDLQARLRQHQEGLFESVTLDGQPSLAFFSKSPRYGWAFVIALPRAEINASVRRAVAMVAAGAAALLGVALWAALRIARGFAQPVQRLGVAAGQLARGEPVADVPTGLRECDEVAAALAHASAQIRGAHAELERRVDAAVRETRETQQRLSQSQRVEALGRLTGGVAHDFNNLLAVIGNSAHVIRRLPRDRDIGAPVGAILRAVDVGSRLTQQLLRFARRQAVHPERVDLAEHLAAIRPLLATVVGASVEVRVAVAEDCPAVRADTAELELALINLALNARDAMPGGGTLTLQARAATPADAEGLPPGDYAALEVTDSGSGVQGEAAARVFEPFFTTKPLGKGTGLGLSQVHGFCTQAGGTARLLPGAGGARFLLVLPACRDAAPGAPDTGTTPAGPPAAAAQGRVLLVEDNAELAAASQALLGSIGFEVEVVHDADSALARLASGAPLPDVVLSDVVMPGELDGIALAERLAQRTPPLPVVLTSGYSGQRQPPGVTLLQKPCTPQELVDALTAAMARRAPDAPDAP